MAKKKVTGHQALKAMRDARYKYKQIQAACEEFGQHPVTIAMLQYVAKEKRKMSDDLGLALVKASKGLAVKV